MPSPAKIRIACTDAAIHKKDDWAIRAPSARRKAASSQRDTWAFLSMGSLAACSRSVPPDASCALLFVYIVLLVTSPSNGLFNPTRLKETTSKDENDPTSASCNCGHNGSDCELPT